MNTPTSRNRSARRDRTSVQGERIAAVVEFSPRIEPTFIGDEPSRLAELLDAIVNPLWWWTSKHVDDWGRDNDLTNLAWTLSRARWDVSVAGAERIGTGAGLIVVNQRRLSLAPLWAALALGAALDRPVRFAGRPELPVVGPVLQRIGGLLAVDDDIDGALRSQQLVVVGADETVTDRSCGAVDPTIIETALRTGADVYPAATGSALFGRTARVDVLAPIRPPNREGLLRAVEMSDGVRCRIDEALAEFGQTSTDSAPDRRIAGERSQS